MNAHVAPYWHRVSEGKFRVTFRAGHEIFVTKDKGNASGTGWFGLARTLLWKQVADCSAEGQGCPWRGYPGGLNRIFFSDITKDTGGAGENAYASLGLTHLSEAYMMTILHEMGHGWMGWPHSFTELRCSPTPAVRS